MTSDEMKNLKPGDVVRSKVYGISYIVSANYGSHVTAVRTADITNPLEWSIVQSGTPQEPVHE